MPRGPLPSPETVFQAVVAQLEPAIRGYVLHSTAGLLDARGVSDVQLAILHPQPHDLLPWCPPGTKVADWDADFSLYEIPGFPRRVILFASADVELARRGPLHREIELWLEREHPALAARARRLKHQGQSTEAAWALVLGLQGKPEEALLQQDLVRASAAALGGHRQEAR